MQPATAAFLRDRSKVLAAVALLPEGRVATYGGVGKRLGLGPRRVAAVLASLTAEEAADLPWHRVVGAGGKIRTAGRTAQRQAMRLRAEDVSVLGGKIADFEAVSIEPCG